MPCGIIAPLRVLQAATPATRHPRMATLPRAPVHARDSPRDSTIGRLSSRLAPKESAPGQFGFLLPFRRLLPPFNPIAIHRRAARRERPPRHDDLCAADRLADLIASLGVFPQELNGLLIASIRSKLLAAHGVLLTLAWSRPTPLPQSIGQPPDRMVRLLPAAAQVFLEDRAFCQRYPHIAEAPQAADLPAERQRCLSRYPCLRERRAVPWALEPEPHQDHAGKDDEEADELQAGLALDVGDDRG
jgi:hypothetical protein